MANIVYRSNKYLFYNVNSYRLLMQNISLMSINYRFFSNDNNATRYYTKKHEWITVVNNIGTVGISDYAQNTLGDIVFVQLPEVGSEVNTSDECGALESVKAASELYSPVSGTVTENNTILEEKPELVNTDCYNQGWLFKLTIKDPKEINLLLNEVEYKEFIISDEEKIKK